MKNIAVEFKNVYKAYGKKQVLNGLDMQVPEGSVYAFLGCNGVGKSTSVKIIVGQLEQDSGAVEVLGLDPIRNPVELRLHTGYVAENQRLYNEMSLREFCGVLESFFPDWDRKRCGELVRRFKLPLNSKLGTFSRGMYSKAALVGALSRSPRLLILDDPTLGFDTVARREFMDGILETVQEFHHTILISSHLIPELEGLCDHAGIIGNGRMLAEGELDRIRADYSAVQIPEEFEVPRLPGEIRRTVKAKEREIVFKNTQDAVGVFLLEHKIESPQWKKLSLEDIFIALTEAE